MLLGNSIMYLLQVYIYSKTSLNRPFAVLTSIGRFREVVDLENIKK